MQQELVILSSSPVFRDGACISDPVAKPNVWPCDARLKSGQHGRPVPDSAAAGFQKASTLPRNESPEKTAKTTTRKPRRKKSQDVGSVLGDAGISHENIVVKRRGRPRKDSSTTATKSKVTKPRASKAPNVPKVSKQPATKAQDVTTEDKENATVMDLTGEPATKRRTTWTPPPAEAVALKLASPSEANADFKDALADMSFVDTVPKAAPRKSKENAPLKRKRIELVKTTESNVEQVKMSKKTSPTRKPSLVKKPKTITELATAKYALTTDTQVEDNSFDQNATPPDAKGKGKKIKKESKPKVLSPDTLLRRTGAQRLSFGTSSQLMFPETGQYLRELQKALDDSKSEVSFSGVVQTSIELDSRRFRKANMTSTRSIGIWDAGATSSAQNLFDRFEQNLMNATPRPKSAHVTQEDVGRSDEEKVAEIPQPTPPSSKKLDISTADEKFTFQMVDDILHCSSGPEGLSLGFIPVDDYSNAKSSQDALLANVALDFKTDDDGLLEVYPQECVLAIAKSTTPLPEFQPVANSKDIQTVSNVNQATAEFIAVDDLLHSDPKSELTLDVSQFFTKQATRKKKDSPGFVLVDEILQKTSPVANIKGRKKRAVATKKSKKSSAKDFVSLDEILDSEPDLTPSPPRLDKPKKLALSPQRKSKKQLQEEAWDRAKSIVFKSITSFILNTKWHERILMYEPIILEDFTEWLQEKGLKMEDEGITNTTTNDNELKPWMVRQWCEDKSICCLWRLTNRKTVRK